MKNRLVFLCVMFLLLLASCSREKIFDENNETIKKYIFAYTFGDIPRESIIQIRFRSDTAPSNRVNTVLDKSLFTFSPSIKGHAEWKDARTLTFRPEKALPGGQSYLVVLDLSQIIKDFNHGEKFKFTFATIRQTFEVNIEGLESSDPSDLRAQQLKGSIVTADAANGIDVEKVLNPEYGGEKLEISWSHSSSQREHTFVISGIMRKQEQSEMTLNFDGKPIESEKTDKKTVTVPKLDEFDVVQVKTIQNEEQYVEIRFSDQLQKNQNLNGLITIDNMRNLRFTIDNNIVRVYSTTPWPAEVNVHVLPGIKNSEGRRYEGTKLFNSTFEELKPQVRFIGKGVILPTSKAATIPIETINLNAVNVEAVRIFEDNIPQFFQVNNFEGVRELYRVGDVVWKKTIPLNFTPDKKNRRVRYGLDIDPLIQKNPGAIYRITVSFDHTQIVYDSPAGKVDWDEVVKKRYDYREYYNQRLNPYHPAYYQGRYNQNTSASRNVFVSDIGIAAKCDRYNTILIIVTDIVSAEPLTNAQVKFLDFQQQVLGSVETNGDGMASFTYEKEPFLAIVSHGNQKGYLKLDESSALVYSHFDVGGEIVREGIKGFLYSERGVWRPGDKIYLTFILMDPDKRFPNDYPVQFELYNSRRQLVTTLINKNPVNGFYKFETSTAPDAPTGNWIAQVKVGGVTFDKILKIETVMPNRLKMDLSFEGNKKSLVEGDFKAKLFAAWLHGAAARNLKSDIQLDLTSVRTTFPDYKEYIFDDPVLQYVSESQKLFEGNLDETGKTVIEKTIKTNQTAPGMLNAHFIIRVFEPGGTFSTDHFTMPYYPYKHYIGVTIPDESRTNRMLSLNKPHTLDIVSVDSEGKPVSSGKVEIQLYNVRWRWWYESGNENLADFLQTTSYRPVKTDTVKIEEGKASWTFNVTLWGRYLVRVRDMDGGHTTGKVFYMDWPSMAERNINNMPGGADILIFSADKEEYSIGETVNVTIPTGQKGKLLLSIETGSKILRTTWIDAGKLPVQYKFTATDAMSPNVYLHAEFIQPHLQTNNDLPIRMYGVIPIKVVNSATRLNPVLELPSVFVPEQTAHVSVSETNGKPMTYTLAVVDEGLLALTRFITPDPWSQFYKREALGIKTWDLYSSVVGAYGGSLEKFLAIGGGDEGSGKTESKRANRFPTMVLFLGPFELKKGEKNSHDLHIPQYVGSVRVMIVAGQNSAFGSAEKTVFVRKPLMILGTLPRVIGPNEKVDLPVSVFAMEDSIKDVAVNIKTKGTLTVVGDFEKKTTFAEKGDKLVEFKLKAASGPGIGEVTIQASSGSEIAEQKIELDSRMPTFSIVAVDDTVLEHNETWIKSIKLPGIEGTNKAMLEVSQIPPINLEQRIRFLIQYPYGCVEQTTSAAFPQLYLSKLLEMTPVYQDNIMHNVTTAIERLRTFQNTEGGFSYWPGYEEANLWGTNYAGHFLLEAQKAGYSVPQSVIQEFLRFQRARALSWNPSQNYHSELIQAYRLYTLALAGKAELGAMNRLKETQNLPSDARWRLAAAYQLAGQPEAAEKLLPTETSIGKYRELSGTYGSDIRDKAMIVETLCLMNQRKRAMPLVQEMSAQLSSNEWMSTQTIAYTLIAIAQFAGLERTNNELTFTYSWKNGPSTDIKTKLPIIQAELDTKDTQTGTITLRNTGTSVIYPRIIKKGVPPVGSESAGQNNMVIKLNYLSLENEKVDPSILEQGTDFVVEVTITNTGITGTYQEVALSHIFPSGLEIRNERMIPTLFTGQSSYNYRDVRDDRVYTFFDINQSESKTFRVLVNASYTGEFYLPMISAEAMYDATLFARIPGEWIKIVKPGTSKK